MRRMVRSLDVVGRSRRTLIISGGAALATAWAGAAPLWASRDVSSGPDPFTLGVASGDPWADSVVLWTRLAPQPLAEDGFGGMPGRAIGVRWEIADDEHFTRIVRRGEVQARPDDAHAVHVDVQGLRPGREYHYRFMAMGHRSRPGRTRTAPAAADRTAARFGVVSCARYESGYFTAYRHLAEERPDLVLHLGDYIYEYAGNPKTVRPFEASEIVTLTDYRRRYALYRTDPDLQALHAASPFAVVWDDHEIDNNWAGTTPEDGMPRDQFLARRAAAFRAYHEVMPLRRAQRPAANGARLYRRLAWGGLANLYMLDTRQYRDDQACGDGTKADCAARLDPSRTMLGAEQERWLHEGARTSRARWDVLGQQVFFGDLMRPLPDGRDGAPLDSWNGYVAARDRVLDMFSDRPRNFIVLTGDVHRHFAGTLHGRGNDPERPVIGAEFVTTSITSAGDGTDDPTPMDPVMRRNPNIAFTCDRRGYVMHDVSDAQWTSHFRVVPWVTRPDAPLETRRTFVVEAGVPGLQRGNAQR